MDMTPGKSSKKCFALSIGKDHREGHTEVLGRQACVYMHVHTHTFIPRYLICLHWHRDTGISGFIQ